MNIAVIYRSKYGHTKKYAKWAAESLNASLFEYSSVKPSDFAGFDVIIFGGGLYAGGLNGLSLIKRNFASLQDKHLIVFACGVADPTVPANTEHIWANLQQALSPVMMEKIKFFHLRGGLDYQKLGPVHKSMMAMLRRMLKKKPPEKLTEEDRQLLDTYGKAVDFTEKSTLDPMIAYVRALN